MKVTIGDSAIYFIWAYQGVIIDDVNLDIESFALKINLTIPSASEITDMSGNELSGEYLKNKVQKIANSLSYSFKMRQDVDIIFDIIIRNEYWKREYAKNSVQEVMDRLINGDPFQLI